MEQRKREDAEEIAVPVGIEELVDRGPDPAHTKGTERENTREKDDDPGPPLGPG